MTDEVTLEIRDVPFVEYIDRLAAVASELPWQAGKPGGALVTQDWCANPASGAEDRAHYGGGLVGESIGRVDREFIAALVNAWPQIRAALLAGKAMHDAHELWVRTLDGGDPDGHLVAVMRRAEAQHAAGLAFAALESEGSQS